MTHCLLCEAHVQDLNPMPTPPVDRKGTSEVGCASWPVYLSARSKGIIQLLCAAPHPLYFQNVHTGWKMGNS